MKIKWLSRHTVVTPHITLCGSEEEYLAVMKYLKCKYFDPWMPSNYGAATHTLERNDKIICVVCMDFNETKTRTLDSILGLLVHEATHIKQQLCESIGEHKPSKEFEAYTIQCISQALVEDFLGRGKWAKQKK